MSKVAFVFDECAGAKRPEYVVPDATGPVVGVRYGTLRGKLPEVRVYLVMADTAGALRWKHIAPEEPMSNIAKALKRRRVIFLSEFNEPGKWPTLEGWIAVEEAQWVKETGRAEKFLQNALREGMADATAVPSPEVDL